MVIYEVNLSVEKTLAGRVSKWLPEHIKRVLGAPGFIGARLFRLDDGTSKMQWTVQYEVESTEALDTYVKDFAPAIRAETEKEFGDQLSITRRTIDRVQTIKLASSEDGALMTDFPKVYCPFIRQTFKVDQAQWKKFGSKYQLRSPEAYLAVNRVNPGYEWVFEDKDTFAVEKLHGTNVKVKLDNGRIVAIQNRKNIVDPLLVGKGQTFILEGILNSASRDFLPLNGEHAGEVIGPKLQGNPYKLEAHEWFPFERTITDLRYKSFDEHERNYTNWSAWFKDHLHSRLFTKRASKRGSDEKVFAEGVIFYNLRRKSEKKTWMAKLRRDMFPWYYSDEISIFDFDPAGRDEAEDQDKFD